MIFFINRFVLLLFIIIFSPFAFSWYNTCSSPYSNTDALFEQTESSTQECTTHKKFTKEFKAKKRKLNKQIRSKKQELASIKNQQPLVRELNMHLDMRKFEGQKHCNLETKIVAPLIAHVMSGKNLTNIPIDCEDCKLVVEQVTKEFVKESEEQSTKTSSTESKDYLNPKTIRPLTNAANAVRKAMETKSAKEQATKQTPIESIAESKYDLKPKTRRPLTNAVRKVMETRLPKELISTGTRLTKPKTTKPKTRKARRKAQKEARRKALKATNSSRFRILPSEKDLYKKANENKQKNDDRNAHYKRSKTPAQPPNNQNQKTKNKNKKQSQLFLQLQNYLGYIFIPITYAEPNSVKYDLDLPKPKPLLNKAIINALNRATKQVTRISSSICWQKQQTQTAQEFCDAFAKPNNINDCVNVFENIQTKLARIKILTQEIQELKDEKLSESASLETYTKCEQKQDFNNTEAKALCYTCYDNYLDSLRPSTYQQVGSALQSLLGAGVGAFGYHQGQRFQKNANRLRVQHGYAAQNDNYAFTGASLGVPFALQGLYGMTWSNVSSGAYACSPSMYNYQQFPQSYQYSGNNAFFH